MNTMSRIASRRLLLAGLVGYAALMLVYGGVLRGQPKETGKGSGAKSAKELTRLYYGVSACSNKGCHGGDPPKAGPGGLPLLCRCDEYVRWAQRDKHADGHAVLSGNRGKQMARILGYDVTRADACLACHAAVVHDDKLKDSTFKVEEGVNCVVCHGAYGEWVDYHASTLGKKREEFRKKSRLVKEREYGMTDLWDPLRRTELCASCHIGNLDQGKFVTHEMYAAGHPPLPGFEVTTFSDEMPRHWQYLREKSAKVQSELGYKDTERERAKLALVGAVVSLRVSMELLAQQAAACQKAIDARDTDGDKKVLDFANFDCYACHHDLKSPSWRQSARHYKGRKPGRIPMRPWSAVLVELAIDQAGEDRAGFEAGLKAVQEALTAKPFGDPRKVAKEASALAKWAGGLSAKLNGKPVSQTAAKQIAESIPKRFTDRPLDYDSARQVAWGLAVFVSEGGGSTRTEAFKTLTKQLRLDFPAGRMGKEPEGTIVRELPRSLERLNGFDAEAFGNQLRKFRPFPTR
jgi:hypothetical protein